MSNSRILVIHVSRIGDTLLATPALRALAAGMPGATIDCLAHPNRAEVLLHLPFLRRVGIITKQRASFGGWWSALSGRKPYDCALVYGFDQPLVAYALRVARRVVAFRQEDDAINRRLMPAVDVPAFQSEHAVDQLLRLTGMLGIKPGSRRIAYTVSDEEQAWAESRLAADFAQRPAPLVGLQVASFPTKAYRDWPIESFVALCDRIRSRWPAAGFLIFGGSVERERTQSLARHLGPAARHYAGDLSLRQTGALMQQLDIYVGVDTGPTHLMSAFDIPMVGLYHGFSRSELIGPLDHPCCYAVDHPRAGPGCSTEESMADIAVDTVFARVEQALGEHPPRGR